MHNIAIIGTGISGMASAYLLQQAGHRVTVYEKSARIGGHTRTLTIDYGNVPIAVDTGFIVYNEPNYPNLLGLFRHLNVKVQKSDMSFAITVASGKFEWSARTLNSIFGQRSHLFNPAFYSMIRDVLRFNSRALEAVRRYPEMTLRDLITHLKLGKGFMDYYLLPMGGAIWSCAPESMLNFPAATFVQFFKNHGLLSLNGQHQWYTVTGGSQEYIKKITEPFHDRIRTNCAVQSVTRHADGVSILDSTGQTETYDQVVFASHANETLAILNDASTEEREILGAFHYQKNSAYLHRDTSVMPKRRRCWASWVYHTGTPGEARERAHGIGVTYWMNLLQSIDQRYPLFVTLNPAQPIPEALTFNRHEFEHPIFTRDTLAAQARLPSIQGKNNSWFCGAYTRYGFHEDGLLSAVKVATAMGAPIPWH
ncbi:MAG: NAD(P)/FAD-dependent oxidoreductase [Rickettsiales bacterium]